MFLGKIAVVSLNPFLWLFSSFSPKTALQSFGVQYLRETVLRMGGHGNGVLYKELTGDQQTHCHTVSNMPNITNYTRRRIIALQKGLKPAAIFKKIEEFLEHLSPSFSTVARIIKKFVRTGSIDNLPKSGRPKKMTEMVKDFIETQINK